MIDIIHGNNEWMNDSKKMNVWMSKYGTIAKCSKKFEWRTSSMGAEFWFGMTAGYQDKYEIKS